MNILREWRLWIRPLVIAFYFIAVVVAVPLLIIEFNISGIQKHLQAWYIAGLFVLLAVPISLWGIVQHLIHYTQPHLQRHIIRILWMVPIYATDAWFALRFKDAAIYLNTARECYEAYVLYNFMAYLLQFLTNELPNLGESLEDKPAVSHIFPICCLPKWKNGRKLIMKCKHGVLQYTVVRPVTTVIALITQFTHTYHEGDFQANSAWLYLTIINSFSQGLAMYCLVTFYRATKEELQPIKPIPKFLCIKAIVFFLFWQQVLIAGLVALKIIRADNTKWPTLSAQNIATGLQDFIICIEMFLFAVAHYFSFSHKPYVDYALGYQSLLASFRAMWDVSDVRDDVVDHVRTVGATATEVVTRPLRKKPTGTESEKTPLLNEGPSSRETGTASGEDSEPRNNNNIMGATPPVHIDIDEINEIRAQEQAEQQNHGEAVPNCYGDKPLIDFAKDDSGARDENNYTSGEAHQVVVTTANVHQLLHESMESDSIDNSTVKSASVTGSPARSKAPSVLSQQRSNKEDSVSTYTFESVSDITDTSHKQVTDSLQNLAQFSDMDTASATSQQS